MISSDEELAVAARSGDGQASSALIARYRPLLRSRARSYFLLGADVDDVDLVLAETLSLIGHDVRLRPAAEKPAPRDGHAFS